jgi:hypothetical protein
LVWAGGAPEEAEHHEHVEAGGEHQAVEDEKRDTLADLECVQDLVHNAGDSKHDRIDARVATVMAPLDAES